VISGSPMCRNVVKMPAGGPHIGFDTSKTQNNQKLKFRNLEL